MPWIAGLLVVLAAIGALQWWQTGGIAWLIAALLLAAIAIVLAWRRRSQR